MDDDDRNLPPTSWHRTYADRSQKCPSVRRQAAQPGTHRLPACCAGTPRTRVCGAADRGRLEDAADWDVARVGDGQQTPGGHGRILVNGYAGHLDAARVVIERALARPRNSGSACWKGGLLAQPGFLETSARNWQAALVPLREVAEIFASTKMVDREQVLWGVDFADAALQLGSLQEVEAAIAVL